jgi:protein O-GlcNAc transferase
VLVPAYAIPTRIGFRMATISEALAIAIQHHQADRLDAAVRIYQQILAADPNQVDALHLLGLTAYQTGNLDQAVTLFRQTLELKPQYAEAHVSLGTALKDQGHLDEAAACCRRALELRPDYAEAQSDLGVVLKEQGKLDEAAACWRRAVALKPDYCLAHCNLGVALKAQGKLDEAIVCYRRALDLNPDYAEAHNNLGVVFNNQGKLNDAIACCRRAVELKPNYADAHNNLGVALHEQGQLGEAVVSFCRAIKCKPGYFVAYNNLGNAFKDLGQLEEATACGRRALELMPDYVEAHNNLGNVLKDQGRADEAVACFRRALELKPDFAMAHSNLLFALQYCHGATPTALAEAHAEYDRRHAAPLKERGPGCSELPVYPSSLIPHPSSFISHPSPRPLRLGFVSPDLGQHPVGYFLVRVLENLDPDEHATICYSDGSFSDNISQRLQAAASEWRNVRTMSDERLAEQIRVDRTDILFDLAGHTAHNRLLVFARRPAPIQITWAGYVGTTGLAAMDYLLADRYHVPIGAERHYREQVLRMPDGYICYDPPADAPAVNALPALDRGHVTFGCFNNPAKITSHVIGAWARILGRLPDSRLVLKFKGWNDPGVVRRYTEMFVAHGIDLGRLKFLGYSPHEELLAEYNRIDLALDPFPYCGGLTTCEALWMGVPVVTFPGETFAGRHSLSHLSNVGLTETIAQDLAEYEELAVSLAGDMPRLAALRAGLRERVVASPLCDGKRFANNLAAILRDASLVRLVPSPTCCTQQEGRGLG